MNGFKINVNDIELLIYDFDGVMTDNTVFIFQDGAEAVRVNRSDGLAVSILKEKGVKQVIISTEMNPIVKARAKKVGIPCIQGVGDKLEAVKAYLNKKRIDKRNVVFIGNEINDMAAMQYVGIPIAPADSYPEIRKIAKKVLKTKGGHGVIREFLANVIKDPIK